MCFAVFDNHWMTQRRLISHQYHKNEASKAWTLEAVEDQSDHLLAQNLEDLDALRDANIWSGSWRCDADQHVCARVLCLW
jgi:hypothetical protein